MARLLQYSRFGSLHALDVFDHAARKQSSQAIIRFAAAE